MYDGPSAHPFRSWRIPCLQFSSRKRNTLVKDINDQNHMFGHRGFSNTLNKFSTVQPPSMSTHHSFNELFFHKHALVVFFSFKKKKSLVVFIPMYSDIARDMIDHLH